MREQLIQYVNLLFVGATGCEDIKQEILQNTLDRYDDLIAEGKVTNSLHYFAGDGSLKRRLRLAKNALGHIKRFNKYSKVPD